MKLKKFYFMNVLVAVIFVSKGKHFKYLGCDLVLPETLNASVSMLQSNEGLKTFVVMFDENNVEINTIVHECWHLFMLILDTVNGNETYTTEELYKEIYAYRFSDLFDIVYNSYMKFVNKKGIVN